MKIIKKKGGDKGSVGKPKTLNHATYIFS